jgi:hypothetical protein
MTPEGTKSGNPSGGAAPKEHPETQDQSKSSRNVSRGIKAALVAAALSTAVAAAARRLGSSGDHAENGQSSDGQGTERSSRVRDAVEKASKRGEPALSAGWRAAEDSLEPLARTGARRAGRYVGERSPEFVRETLMPPFIKGFNEARSETVRRGERGS